LHLGLWQLSKVLACQLDPGLDGLRTWLDPLAESKEGNWRQFNGEMRALTRAYYEYFGHFPTGGIRQVPRDLFHGWCVEELRVAVLDIIQLRGDGRLDPRVVMTQAGYSSAAGGVKYLLALISNEIVAMALDNVWYLFAKLRCQDRADFGFMRHQSNGRVAINFPFSGLCHGLGSTHVE
jgi:hypothetical protein